MTTYTAPLACLPAFLPVGVSSAGESVSVKRLSRVSAVDDKTISEKRVFQYIYYAITLPSFS
jgi:hypothetical protein